MARQKRDPHIQHSASCYGPVGGSQLLRCDDQTDHADQMVEHRVAEAAAAAVASPSLIERMVRLSTLRGRYLQAHEQADLPVPTMTAIKNASDSADEYIAALETEVERHGIVIDRSEP